MGGLAHKPILRHAGTGIPLPWWDSRIVPQQTLMEYLDIDRGSWASMVRSGFLSHPNCTVIRGEHRPLTCYIPAVIWQANGWLPSQTALAALAAGDSGIRALISSTEGLLNELRQIAAGVGPSKRQPIAKASIPFPAQPMLETK